MSSRGVVVHRTEAKAIAIPVDALDTTVPIICFRSNWALEDIGGTDGVSFGGGPDDPIVIELVSDKSLFLQATTTFKWSSSNAQMEAYAFSVASPPSGPPEGQTGHFLNPYAYDRTVTLTDEVAGERSLSVPWTGVVARRAGSLSIVPQAYMTRPGHDVGAGPINFVNIEYQLNVVVGSFSDDECLEWGSPA